jgi:ABC-type multidrug transport system ATPase subunit
MECDGDPAIEVHGLSKRFGDVTVVAGIDFEVRRGNSSGS